jgi:hypothetical protein
MWYSNLEKTFISQHILHQHWYTCPIALPVRRNPQHRSIFECCLSHFHTSVSTSSSSAKRLPPSCEPLYKTNTSHCKEEKFLYRHPLHLVILPTKRHNRTLFFGSIHLKHGHHFWVLKPASEHAHAHLLPRLLWIWTVLLPSDTHRKPIKSFTAVLFPFVTNLLTLLGTSLMIICVLAENRTGLLQNKSLRAFRLSHLAM